MGAPPTDPATARPGPQAFGLPAGYPADRRWLGPAVRTAAQTARSAGGVPPEKEFGQGLAIVLRGFRAMLAEPSPLTREQP